MPGEAAIRESRRRAKSAGTEGARRGRTTPQGAGTLVVRLKRAYDPPAPGDGGRVLVDRVWPRGVSKEKIRVDAWLPNLGPTAPLRKWFGHDPAKWDAFRRRYRQELAKKRDLLQELVGHAKAGRLTLVYGARDPAHNQAVVIKEVLEGSAGGQRSPTTGPGAC